LKPKERDLLRRTANVLDVTLSESHLDAFGVYLEELLVWNRKVNLIGLRSRDRICVELLADSLAPVPWIPNSGRMLDIGSGAGLPGIPIKILRPGLTVDLLEPSAKKHSFLKHVLRLLQMEGIRAIRGRAERSDKQVNAGAYDMVTARAVAGLGVIVKMCSPYISEGGFFLGFLGNNAERELSIASIALVEASLHLKEYMTYGLPGKKGERRVVLFQKEPIS
jgi:16S rRNA (guanine527-N7)-methyltransferase